MVVVGRALSRARHPTHEYAPRVSGDQKNKARGAVRKAQERFERDAQAVRDARREAFAEAQAAGLSLREIAKEAGLHHSRIAEVIRGK
jgi:DNA-directed RNA polymerase specialized sigma24 family protein